MLIIFHFSRHNSYLLELLCFLPDFDRKISPSIISQTVEEHTVLVTFQVESLYSNIRNSLGSEATEYWIENFTREIQNRFSKAFIIESLSFIL